MACYYLLPATVLAEESVTDVRTLIDISGSMKQNDPRNLRKPALRLLVELMPEGTHAGVWTFGQYVNMNVKQGKVDAAWKNKARAEVNNIHSRGLYTNIEEVIRKASFGWDKPDSTQNRNMILLTDGVVDISKDAQLNQQSRERIVNELLPQLKKAKVKIHTVALSKEADHELLKEMSALTGGWYERVDDAEQLQKVFLRLFEKSAPVDTLPIKANKFQVDKHVKDMTLVLFHKGKGKSASVITPGKQTISREKHDDNVSWHQEESYELITIKQPEPGEWQLQTEADPDNRVMVVTNLRLKVNSLPNTILLGDELTVKAHLTEDGKTISREDFLRLVEFKLLQDRSKEDLLTLDMKDDGSAPDELAGDGKYSSLLTKTLTSGQHMLLVRVNGPTFRREYRHLLQVFETPAFLEINHDQENNFVLTLKPLGDILQLPSVSAQVKLPDGKTEIFTQDGARNWGVILPASYQQQKVLITLVATRMDDKPLKLEFERVLSSGKETEKAINLAEKVAPAEAVKPAEEAPPQAEKHGEEPAQAANEVKEQVNVEETHHDKKTDEHPEGEFNWIFVLSLTLVINLLALVGGIVGYKLWKKRKAKQDSDEEEEIQL